MKNYRILLIDNEISFINTMVDIFEKRYPPYEVMQTIHPKRALTIAEAKQPNLIITDWDMPELNGIELIQKLKENPLTTEIPIIMCTGAMTTSENLEEALGAGAVDYIRKPIDEIELMARVQTVLKLSESYKRIKELVELKDKFFSIIAHDLRNPFNSLIGFSDFLLTNISKFSPQKINRYVKNINDTSKQTYSLLENLLKWARIQNGTLKPNPQALNVEELVYETMLVYKPIATSKKIEINATLHHKGHIFADLEMIKTVLRNLVSNAIKFTYPEGSITVETLKKDNNAVFSISDTGIGIEEKHLAKVFKIENKLSKNGTANEKGTGLGLILCKEFVEKNNGTIWVESQVGKGSSFKFTMPLT